MLEKLKHKLNLAMFFHGYGYRKVLSSIKAKYPAKTQTLNKKDFVETYKISPSLTMLSVKTREGRKHMFFNNHKKMFSIFEDPLNSVYKCEYKTTCVETPKYIQLLKLL